MYAAKKQGSEVHSMLHKAPFMQQVDKSTRVPANFSGSYVQTQTQTHRHFSLLHTTPKQGSFWLQLGPRHGSKACRPPRPGVPARRHFSVIAKPLPHAVAAASSSPAATPWSHPGAGPYAAAAAASGATAAAPGAPHSPLRSMDMLRPGRWRSCMRALLSSERRYSSPTSLVT